MLVGLRGERLNSNGLVHDRWSHPGLRKILVLKVVIGELVLQISVPATDRACPGGAMTGS